MPHVVVVPFLIYSDDSEKNHTTTCTALVENGKIMKAKLATLNAACITLLDMPSGGSVVSMAVGQPHCIELSLFGIELV